MTTDYVRKLAEAKSRLEMLEMFYKFLSEMERDVVLSGTFEMFLKYLSLKRRYSKEISMAKLHIEIIELLIEIEAKYK